MGRKAAEPKPDWDAIRREWRKRDSILKSEDLLKLRMTAGPETSHAAAVTQEILPMVVRWLQRAFPLAKYPPVGVPKVLARTLLRYATPVYRRHCELEQLGITWSEYLVAQTDGLFMASGKTTPDLWTVFNSVGIERFNRWYGGTSGLAERVDGKLVRRVSDRAMRALEKRTRWEELVERWSAGRDVLKETLLTCPELSPESAILLEAHMIDSAFLIADRDGLMAMESGILPEKKTRGALELLDELEKDKYTCQRFYAAVKEKGAML